MIEHKPTCAILPLETWDRKTFCDCGAWDARVLEARTRDHCLLDVMPLVEEALWAPLTPYEQAHGAGSVET